MHTDISYFEEFLHRNLIVYFTVLRLLVVSVSTVDKQSEEKSVNIKMHENVTGSKCSEI